MSRVKTTLWNLAFNYVSFLLVVISAFVLVPLYLAYLPTRLYGAWLAASNVLSWITLVDPGIATVLMQRVASAYGENDYRAVHALASAGLMLALVTSGLILLLGIGVSAYVGDWFQLSDITMRASLSNAFLVAVIGTALTVASYPVTTINQGLQCKWGPGLVYLVATLTSYVATVVLLIGGYGLMGLAFGIVIRGSLLLLGNVGYLVWRFSTELHGFRLSTQKIREIVGLSGYQFFGQAGSILSTQIELFVIAKFLTPEVVPVFVLTKRAPDTLKMLAERPSTAFMPAVAHAAGAGETARARTILLRLTRMVIWVVGLLIGGVAVLNDDFVRLWVGTEFFAGWAINAVVCVSLLVTVLVRNFANLCQALGNIKGSGIAVFFEGLMCSGLLLLGVTYLGLIGVALAPLLATLAVSAWYFPRSFGQLLQVNLADLIVTSREFVRAGLSLVVPTAVLWSAQPDGWIAFSFAVATFSALYAGALCLVSGEFRGECRSLIKLIRSRQTAETAEN